MQVHGKKKKSEWVLESEEDIVVTYDKKSPRI